MLKYRKLSDKESRALAHQILAHDTTANLRDFLDAFYGEEDYDIDVVVEEDDSQMGPLVKGVYVHTPGGKAVLPDLCLPDWTDYLANDPDVYDEEDLELGQATDRTNQYMQQAMIFVDFSIPAESCKGMHIPATLPTLDVDVYVLE